MAGNAVATLRVLVCDDEPGMRAGVVRALRDFVVLIPEVSEEVRFTVEQAESGEEALKRVEAAPPDILLLDHKLPAMTGLDVLDYLAPRKLDTLTIMITAYASIETAVRATKQGAYDFLAKPFTPAELRNAVRKAAEHVVVAQQARMLAREKRQVRFQFISVLAHELKAPLGAVEGYLHLLQDRSAKIDPETCDHMLSRCLTRTLHMRKMINDLLDLTRIESGQRRRDLARVDLAAQARTAIETALPAARDRGITLHLHGPSPLWLEADASELDIVLNNLIGNAVKYNRDQGRVDVTLAENNGQVTVRVADTGIGMTPEEAGRIFQDFVRIKNKKTRNIDGSGLGLSTVRKLAQLYGGAVSVSSAPDEGSVFTVTLPSGAPPGPSPGETPGGAAPVQ